MCWSVGRAYMVGVRVVLVGEIFLFTILVSSLVVVLMSAGRSRLTCFLLISAVMKRFLMVVVAEFEGGVHLRLGPEEGHQRL